MKNKRIIFSITGIVGIILILMGVFVFNNSDQDMISGLCFGIGGACAVLGVGSLIQSLMVSPLEDEEIKRKKDIEIKDERNTSIREKSGYMVSRIMNYFLFAYTLFLIFMKAELIFIILAVALILLQLILIIYYSNYYSKKM
ncbi:DUF2178 domain-containing protein [Haloimpatiens lingqiaonensis]|uniref:DUF2178 domain-containing protein n=1 Tax=Haloimpatiens lingqiaonensis TaxID=1380675 RepID=UPI0010FE809C|nr:DUF2178 domain-containing protein [Haloimpatiens lingqiaonensis]